MDFCPYCWILHWNILSLYLLEKIFEFIFSAASCRCLFLPIQHSLAPSHFLLITILYAIFIYCLSLLRYYLLIELTWFVEERWWKRWRLFVILGSSLRVSLNWTDFIWHKQIEEINKFLNAYSPSLKWRSFKEERTI